MQKKCLEPWIDDKTRILIVGTMPGDQSIAQQMYYANPYNKFWSYIEKILNNGQKLEEAKRKQFLQDYSIGLWYSLSICERNGSLDSKIKNYKPNDFSKFQSIKYIICNGKKAYKYFITYNAKYLQNQNIECMECPSTSPANASIPDDFKFEKWKEALLSVLEK